MIRSASQLLMFWALFFYFWKEQRAMAGAERMMWLLCNIEDFCPTWETPIHCCWYPNSKKKNYYRRKRYSESMWWNFLSITFHFWLEMCDDHHAFQTILLNRVEILVNSWFQHKEMTFFAISYPNPGVYLLALSKYMTRPNFCLAELPLAWFRILTCWLW